MNVTFLSNISREYAPLVKQAARATGFKVYVAEATEPVLPDSIGVYTFEIYRDHRPFWAEFNRLWMVSVLGACHAD